MNNFEILAIELEEKEKARIEGITHGLNELIKIVKNSIVTHNEAGYPSIESTLNDDELYALVVRIPAECIYVQAQADALALNNALRSILTDSDVSESIQLLQGAKGDAKERLRRAEASCSDKLLRDAAIRQSVKALNACVERADKVYEGVKKIIDARSREMLLNGKPGSQYN